MPGRKPIPTNLKLLRGNPGKRPLNDREPEPERKLPRAPEHLSAEAKREWRRMARTLYDLGLLTEIDRAALAAYCVAWGRWVEAEQNLQKYGTVMLSPDKGWPVQSPYLAIANRAMEQLQKFMVEFGMTPSSRSRVKAAASNDKPEDAFNDWLSSGRNSG